MRLDSLRSWTNALQETALKYPILFTSTDATDKLGCKSIMKIVILTGGTGSIALQRGIHSNLERKIDGVDIKILINAYDNGLSTGIVRRVMGGQILGPSDVRKNQATRLSLQDPVNPWLTFLNCRFTAEASSAHEHCREEVHQLVRKLQQHGLRTDWSSILLDSIEEFFKSSTAATIRYDDFSLANIIYAGLAKANGNSMRAAASIMARALGIEDNVLLNDDRSLFLGAITHSGKKITDEGDIVAWENESDPFVDLFFVDAAGSICRPELCLEAWRALIEADLVILSAGTQWSSLIPTYASNGFRAAIRESSARIVLVMNRAPDRDSPSQTASDIINILVPRYFDEGRLDVLIDIDAHPNMARLDPNTSRKASATIVTSLSTHAELPDKHNPAKLANAVGRAFFRDYLDSNVYLFDYDDTLVGRNHSYPKASKFNVSGLRYLHAHTDVGICTGNTVNAIQLIDPSACTSEPDLKPLLVFADGGANAYSYPAHTSPELERPRMLRCVSPEALLSKTGPHSTTKIIEALRRSGIPDSIIQNRGDAVIAIKPIEEGYRRAVMCLARNVVEGSGLQVRESGRTTIEIYNPSLSKLSAVKHLHNELASSVTITYVGDECRSGNDRDIGKFAATGCRLRCLHVTSPAMTAFFISTLIAHLDHNATR